MKKVLCLIYPNFSLYEITALTSTLALSFDSTIDYAASDHSIVFLRDFARNGQYRACSTG